MRNINICNFYSISFSPLVLLLLHACWWWWWCLLMQCSKSLAPMIYTSSSQPAAQSRHDYYTMFAFGTMRKLAFSIFIFICSFITYVHVERSFDVKSAPDEFLLSGENEVSITALLSNSHLCVWFTTTTRRLTCAHQSRNSSCPEYERD